MQITNQIITIRDEKVLLDSDLADIYGVSVAAVNQAAKTNKELFPEDFCFQLNTKELEIYNSEAVN